MLGDGEDDRVRDEMLLGLMTTRELLDPLFAAVKEYREDMEAAGHTHQAASLMAADFHHAFMALMFSQK